jgi:hypothetical protein
MNKLDAVNVSMSFEKLEGKDVVKVIKDSTITKFDEPTFETERSKLKC